MDIAIPRTLEQWNAAGVEYLPGHLGIEFVSVEPQEVVARLTVHKTLMAWNGFLHAGAVVSLADTCCGNFLGSAREGVIQCTARPLHQGRTTQVWDAVVAAAGSAKPIAQFRCTQMILWPKG